MARQIRSIVSFQADVVKALGHPLRIEIVNYLKGQERSVTEIIRRFAAEPSVVSRQLAILKRAGILASRKSGLNVHYRVAMRCIPGFLNCIGRAIGGKFN